MELWGEGRGVEVIDRLSKVLFEGEIQFNGSDQNHNDSFDSCLIYKVEREEDDFFNNIRNRIVSKGMQTKLVVAKKNDQTEIVSNLIQQNFGGIFIWDENRLEQNITQ